MSNFNTGQNVRKKIITNITKYFQELAKIIESVVHFKGKAPTPTTLSKNHSNYYPKVVNLDIKFTTQIYDYTRSLFHVQLEKFEDILKYLK